MPIHDWTRVTAGIFLTLDLFVKVPLEATYQAAYRGVARRWREVLEP
jgi:hypothetical protein